VRTDPGLAPLYDEAARRTAAGSKSFYFATRFFPRPMARSAHAVYWFCRHTDDLVDEAPSLRVGRRQLDEWSMDVDQALNGGEPRHPALRLFVQALREHGIPHQYPLELLEGMRMDLECRRYWDFSELRTFCYRVASVVGLMMSHVIGYRGPALGYAEDLGIAMQLTNILRDVGEDLERGRIYLPQEELDAFGYSENDLRAGRRTAAFRRLMQFQTARARHYYERAMPGIALLHRDGRFAVQVAADVYRRILHQIETSDFDVFHRRAVVPGRVKYWLTARAMLLARSA
jgi:phytoene synthase